MSKTEVGHNKADEISVMDIIHETDEALMKNCDRGLENAALAAAEGSIFKTSVTVFHHTYRPLAGK